MAKINVQHTDVTILKINEEDYISLTDIAKFKTTDPFIVVCNWMRNRNTIEYLGIWETLYNIDFKPIEFDRFKNEAGLNAFTMSPQKRLIQPMQKVWYQNRGVMAALLHIKILLSNLQPGFLLNSSCTLSKNSNDLKKKSKNN